MNTDAHLEVFKVVDCEVRSKEGVSKDVDAEVTSVYAQDAKVLIRLPVYSRLNIVNHVIFCRDAELPLIFKLKLERLDRWTHLITCLYN